MRVINTKARIAVCDQMSMYNSQEPDTGPRYFSQLILKQAKVEGFLVQQFADRFEEGLRQLSTWLREKKIRYHEDIVEGLENAPRALIEMLEGQNVGKRLVKVAA
jgi:NADPH-dependent curcumin reductase CurA